MFLFYSYVGEVNPNLICCICHSAFLNPVVTATCSHTFCRSCIERTLEQQPSCPVDRSPLSLMDLKPENLLLRNMVDELIVECLHRSSGCKATCQRQLLDTHLRETCQYVQVPCSEEGCDQMVLRRDLGKHTHDCVHRLVNCPACGTSVTASELEAHNNKCAEQETECVACFGRCKRSELNGHIATCSDVEVVCEHSDHGCPWRGKRRDLEEHLAWCPYEGIKGFFAVNEARFLALRDENTVLRQNLSKAEASVHALSRELAIARRALGPWWRSAAANENSSNNGGSPRVSSSEISDTATIATSFTSTSAQTSSQNQVGSGYSEQIQQQQSRLRVPNPLTPILAFSPEGSPVSQSDDVEVFGSASNDPAFLAPYFPSGVNSSASDGPNPSVLPATAPPPLPVVQVDPLTRHLFPFSNRFQSIYPPPPIRFSDLHPPSTSQTPQQQQQQTPSSRVLPLDRATSLESALTNLRTSISSVSSALDLLARRTDIALTTENLRMNEEVGALRAIVHGLRMQVHALITERNGSAWGTAGAGGSGTGAGTTTTTTTAYYNHPPPPPHPPLVVNSTTKTTKL